MRRPVLTNVWIFFLALGFFFLFMTISILLRQPADFALRNDVRTLNAYGSIAACALNFYAAYKLRKSGS